MIVALAAFHFAVAILPWEEPHVPEPFLGLWALHSAACDDLDSSDRLEVLENRLQFYEWGADVARIDVRGDLSVRFDGDWWDINDTDADERPIVRAKSAALTLSPDRTRLELDVDGYRAHFVRCPEI